MTGVLQGVPEEVTLVGVEEFPYTLGTTTIVWPYEPAAVDYHAAEGRSWPNWLSGDGARAARLPNPDNRAGAKNPFGRPRRPLLLSPPRPCKETRRWYP
ncbi:hypothetical protein [Streptomyces collinus]|uniref:hypothetical protein n=1 Tax=Streptomyces collinus TaxID=42684 RepID=UPI0033E14A04